MTPAHDDTWLRRAALAYVIALYDELSEENGAPTLGTQNQAVDFILTDAELRCGVARWAGAHDVDEATTAPRQRLPQNGVYNRVRGFLEQIMERPVFTAPEGARR